MEFLRVTVLLMGVKVRNAPNSVIRSILLGNEHKYIRTLGPEQADLSVGYPHPKAGGSYLYSVSREVIIF